MKHADHKLVWVVLGLSATALLAFLQLFGAIHGPVGLRLATTAAANTPADPAGIAWDSTTLPVTLVDSTASATHFAAMPGSRTGGHAAQVAAWRTTLEALHADVRVVGDDQLLSRVPDGRVLVLPSVTVLSDAAVDALTARITAGQAVVTSWQLGLYRPNEQWRGYGLLTQLFGLRVVTPPTDPPTLRFGVTRAGHPLNVGLPAGGRFEIQAYDSPLWLSATDAAAEFRRWELLRFDPPLAETPPAAVVYRTIGSGRAVWLNFEIAATTPSSQRFVATLVKNALRWTAGVPRVAVDRWPGGASAALMVGIDTEDRFENGGVMADLLSRANVPGTFFCLSSLAARFPAIVKQLAAAGEVASHTDDHRVVAGRPLEEQARHLRASASELQSLGAPPVTGFRPPEEESDANTLQALAQVGYDYLAGPREKDRAEPLVAPNGVVVLPRIVRDDIYWINQNATDDADRLAERILGDVHQVVHLGGLAFVSVHSQTLDRAPVRAAMAQVVAALAKEHIWRATGQEISRWWLVRDGIAVRAEQTQPQRLQLTITTRRAASGVGFTVYLGQRPNAATIGAAVANPPRELRVVSGTEPAIRLVLDELRAGETRVLDIDLR